MKKRIISIIALIFMTATLAACGITTNPTTTGSSITTTTTNVETTLRQFTLAQLSAYNGDNGSTAYIAVNGVVYDVTGVEEWSDGWHKGMHLAGTDATAAFGDSPHSLSFLNQLDIVGSLVN